MKNSLLKLRERLDMGSIAIIFIAFTLFVVSLFQKGLTHEILVDTGIFWVSVKFDFRHFKWVFPQLEIRLPRGAI